jgi:hypothetical protein
MLASAGHAFFDKKRGTHPEGCGYGGEARRQSAVATPLLGEFEGFDADDVFVAGLDGFEQVLAGFGVELDAAAGGGGAFEDDVLDFFDVGVGAADLVHDMSEHTNAVVMADDELPFRGRAGGEVDAVRDGAGGGVGLDDADGFLGDGLLGLLGGSADVMGAVEIGVVEDRVGEVAGGIGGFGIEDVEAGADFFRGERGGEGGLVDDFAAGRVDENGVGFHEREALSGDKFFGVGFQGDMQTDDVRTAKERIEVGAVLDFEVAAFLQVEGTRPGDDVEAEGVSALDDFLADLADADDAERFAEDAVGFAEFFFVPLMSAKGDDIFREAAVESEEQCEDQLGDGHGIFAGAIGDVHTARARGFHVDGIHARAGADDDGELVAGLDGFGGNFFTADDEDLKGSDQLGKFLGLDGGFVGDVAAEFFQLVEMFLGEFIRNQYFHHGDLPELKEHGQNRAGRRRLARMVACRLQMRNRLWKNTQSYACNSGAQPIDCAAWK